VKVTYKLISSIRIITTRKFSLESIRENMRMS